MAFLNRGLKTQLFSGAHQQYTFFLFCFFPLNFLFSSRGLTPHMLSQANHEPEALYMLLQERIACPSYDRVQPGSQSLPATYGTCRLLRSSFRPPCF